MRTLTDLSKIDKKVFVLLHDKAIQYRFFSDAEREGFTFANKEKPTTGECYHLMAVHRDKTLAYVSGWASQMYYNLHRNKFVTVDYEKYLDGAEDYYIKR